MKRVRIVIFGALALLIVCFIFSNSAEPREESAARSMSIVELLKPILDPHDRIRTDRFDHYVRKAAHFAEFAALGFFYMGFSDGFAWKQRRSLRWLLPLIAGALTASADEFSQFFSIGRGPGLRDVLIDTAGAAFGIAVFLALLWLIRRFRMRRETGDSQNQ